MSIAVQTNGRILQDMSQEALIAEVARLTARLQAQGQRKTTLKVSDKGALSMYGLGRFPVTLYRSQWERLIEAVPEIKAFIEDHAAQLTVKGE